MKFCGRCGVVKTPADFHRNRAKRDGRQSHCKECDSATGASRRLAFPEEARASHLMRQYGVTLEWFAQQLAKQGYLCAICRRATPGGAGEWHVDHAHVPGYKHMSPEEKSRHNRGLLCHTCNTHLGIHEKMEKDTRVAAYRRKYGNT